MEGGMLSQFAASLAVAAGVSHVTDPPPFKFFTAGVSLDDPPRIIDDADLDKIAAQILTKHIKAFEELAK